MKTPMTEYRKMQAMLIAMELDKIEPLMHRELRKRGGGYMGPACKSRELLIDEYWFNVTGEKQE